MIQDVTGELRHVPLVLVSQSKLLKILLLKVKVPTDLPVSKYQNVKKAQKYYEFSSLFYLFVIPISFFLLVESSSLYLRRTQRKNDREAATGATLGPRDVRR